MLEARGHVSQAALVHLDLEFAGVGLVVKTAIFGEHPIDQGLGDPVVADEEEADLFERRADAGGECLERTGGAREEGSEVEHRNQIVALRHTRVVK